MTETPNTEVWFRPSPEWKLVVSGRRTYFGFKVTGTTGKGKCYPRARASVVRRSRKEAPGNHILESCRPQVPLRTLDAIHAAACDLSQDFPLCSTDPRMREAARLLKIPVFPEEAC
jgi:hypothetical protein